MITIHLNDRSLDIDTNTNIMQLLHQNNYPQLGIAVAINQQIVSKNHWGDQQLKDGDKVLIIQATQGG
ncbi:sulfur carrier protein ThiS [Flavobacteriaceae bacterium GSB9]|nr:sulfur carrier protein ThiS [Flavobacteriaceae bacterium GSB9]